MQIIRTGELIYVYRWPWRVTPQSNGGFRAYLPAWARPYRWLAKVLGINLAQLYITRDDEKNFADRP